MIESFSEAQDIAAQAARAVHRKYSTYFDVADVRQELTLWILEHEDKVEEWLKTDQFGSKKLGKTLRRQADKYCRRRKAQAAGYNLEDEAYYPGSVIANLLPYVWQDVAISQVHSGEKISNSGNPAEGGNFQVQIIDIKSALDSLDPQDSLILQMKYYEGQTFAEIAEALEISDTTAHRRHEGALRRLSNRLGGTSPFTKKEIEEQ
jgi:RNA polymerase sigma factor (sigma-70 family)